MSEQDDLEFLKRARDPRHFAKLWTITREDSTTGPLNPTSLQDLVLDYVRRFNWLYVVKHRQAKTSTAVASALHGHCKLRRGQRGIIIAEKEATALEVFSRIVVADEKLPPQLRRGPARTTKATGTYLETEGGSHISTVTGGGNNPAIGHSPDFLMITEYGEVENYTNFNRSVFPAVTKRPNSHVVIETTPGPYHSDAHRMWLNALNGEGNFAHPRGAPLFLLAASDETCVAPVPYGFVRDQAEHALANKLFEQHGIEVSDAHLMFRRLQLNDFYHGDTRLYDSKYPPGPREGWISDGTPAIPQDALQKLQDRPGCRPDLTPWCEPVHEGEERFFEEPEPGAPYLLTCDPAGHGETGDPSAWTLWHGWDRREVGSFSGRIDPVALADRIIRVQRAYNCDVLVEANKDACCAALRAKGCKKLVWIKGQPGWYSTDSSKAAAISDMVDDLRHQEYDLRTQQTLDQLGGWDGRTRKRTTSKNGEGHHYDRAVTIAIAAFGFRHLAYRSRPRRVVAPTAEETAYFTGAGAVPAVPRAVDWIKQDDERRRAGTQRNVAGRRGT